MAETYHSVTNNLRSSDCSREAGTKTGTDACSAFVRNSTDLRESEFPASLEPKKTEFVPFTGSDKMEYMPGMKYLNSQNGMEPGNPAAFSFSDWNPFYSANPVQNEAESNDGSWYQTWFKWYYILPGILVFCYVVMLSESVADSRRKRKEAKEGMQQKNESTAPRASEVSSTQINDDAKLRGIIKLQRDAERMHDCKKRVSFKVNEMKHNIWKFTGSADSVHSYLWGLSKWLFYSFSSFSVRIYQLWILPGVYAFSRSG